ncbi:Cytochrome P450 93A3 [Acorus calamus]|uniref:Cytochrome P450 93A3 n=1 Tax=Acorus calamus TaxID=4465 RepID=A0AAV9EKP1_ACOCL|nr:Cytochrome P450 93A3 [Acorus calamus]
MEGFISSLILLSIWLISTLLLRAAIKILRPGLHHPPTPFALPIIGHLHLLGTLPHQSLHALSQRYGPIIRLHFGSSPCIVASTPDAARAFLKTNDLAFSSRPSSAAIRTLNYGECTFIFAKYGPYWKFMKKLCMSELLNGRMLDNFGPVRHEERVSMIKCLLEKSEANEEVDLRGELMKLSYNVITRMMMSRRGTDAGGGDISDVREIVEESERITGMFNLEDFVWFCKGLDLQGLKKEAKDVHERFDRIIEGVLKEKEMERREGKGRERMKDLFDVLMDVSEDENAEVKLTRDDIKGFSMEVYVAGTDTSSITIEWALAELINHPSVLSKARAEIESIIGKTRLVEETDIPNLPYLQSIVKETFRLHPPAPFILREATKDCVVSGYDIPNKTRLIVNAWSVGRDPEYWEEPMEFRPERFMEEEKCAGVDVRGQHFELLPFGSGRRGCPGASLGLHVVHTTLASLVQCFELRVEDAVVDMKEGSSFNNPREKPLVCVPVARFNPFVTVG